MSPWSTNHRIRSTHTSRAILFISATVCPSLDFGFPSRRPQVVWYHWGEIKPFSATLCDKLLHNQREKRFVHHLVLFSVVGFGKKHWIKESIEYQVSEADHGPCTQKTNQWLSDAVHGKQQVLVSSSNNPARNPIICYILIGEIWIHAQKFASMHAQHHVVHAHA